MSFARMLFVFLCCGSLGTAAAQPFITDDFNSLVLNPSWSWVREDRASWRLTGTAMQITTQPGALNGMNHNNVHNLLLQAAPTQDVFKMSTRVTFSPDSIYHNAGLIYYVDDDNYVRVSRGMYEQINGVWVEWETAGLPDFHFIDAVRDTIIYLRLTRYTPSSFRAVYSLDGSNWMLIGDVGLVMPAGEVRVGLNAANGAGIIATPDRIPATFDYFTIDLSTPVESVPVSPDAPRIASLSPNPLTSGASAMLAYSLPSPSPVQLIVTDVLGRTVLDLQSSAMHSGLQTETFSTGSLPAGPYTVHIVANGAHAARQFVILK